MTNLPASEQWHRLAVKAANLEAAADLLENTKSAVLSQMMVKSNAPSVAKAEMLVKASPEWMEHVHKIAKARAEANLAKIEAEYYHMRYFEAQSHSATERTMARL